jgi:hypothetical protein
MAAHICCFNILNRLTRTWWCLAWSRGTPRESRLQALSWHRRLSLAGRHWGFRFTRWDRPTPQGLEHLDHCEYSCLQSGGCSAESRNKQVTSRGAHIRAFELHYIPNHKRPILQEARGWLLIAETGVQSLVSQSGIRDGSSGPEAVQFVPVPVFWCLFATQLVGPDRLVSLTN